MVLVPSLFVYLDFAVGAFGAGVAACMTGWRLLAGITSTQDSFESAIDAGVRQSRLYGGEGVQMTGLLGYDAAVFQIMRALTYGQTERLGGGWSGSGCKVR